ncbi:MAG: hypothetical protein ACYTFY_13310 [Planctomycetota bacterium]|jgi:hypothetical protein
MNKTFDIGNRRELMLDDYLAEELKGDITYKLHNPVPQEVCLKPEEDWESDMWGFATVLKDVGTGLYRMYYKNFYYNDILDPTLDPLNHPRFNTICMATSKDGINWKKPLTDRYPVDGYKTNIVFKAEGQWGKGWHGFSPFFDSNPDCPPHEQYKAVGGDNEHPATGLYLLTSCDGIKWEQKGDSIFFSDHINERVAYDSHNLCFWDPQIKKYRLYYRDYHHTGEEKPLDKARAIRYAESDDFENWSKGEWLSYEDEDCFMQMYTNNIKTYYRAPHILMGFPARYIEREWTPSMDQLPELEERKMRIHRGQQRFGTSLSDGLFMSSRDGKNFKRWREAFFRPGLRKKGNWAYGDNYPCFGMIETKSELTGYNELSFYQVENYWRGARFRRHTLRLDGFVSLHADYTGGEFISKPFIFDGEYLSLNMATSAAGSLYLELQDEAGKAIPGYSIEDCWEVIGDNLDYTVKWKEGGSVEKLAGNHVRMKIVMKDADLYSFKFCKL